MAVFCVCLFGVGCQNKGTQKIECKASVNESLYDKPLTEIKELINGKWTLVSAKNYREFCEYENITIELDNDNYVWIEDGKKEPGKLNWRKADTGAGSQAYIMDLFYETKPAYPLLLKGDTLYIQDCSPTAYKYMLLRK